MLHTIGAKSTLVPLLFVQLLTSFHVVHAGWSGGDACSYAGYQPAGTGAEPVSPIASPVIQAFDDSLGYAFDVIGHVSGNTGAAISLIEKASSKLTHVAKDLAIFGTIFAAVGFDQAPTANDILDKVNDAFTEITAEMNRRIEDLQNYVDARIIEKQRDLVSKQFESLKISIAQCIGNYDDEEEQLDCQQRTVDKIYAKQPFFQVHKNAFDLYLRRKSNNEVRVHLSDDQVSQLEAILTLYRPWASLWLYMANTVSGGFAKQNDSRGQTYLTRIRDYGMMFYNYSVWAYEEMYHNKIAKHKDENGKTLQMWTDGGMSTEWAPWYAWLTKDKTYVVNTAIANCYPMKDGGRCKYAVSKERTNQIYNLKDWQKRQIQAAKDAARRESMEGAKSKCVGMVKYYERDFKTYWERELLKPCKKFMVASEAATKRLEGKSDDDELVTADSADTDDESNDMSSE